MGLRGGYQSIPEECEENPEEAEFDREPEDTKRRIQHNSKIWRGDN